VSDAAIEALVRREMANRGGFEPLMHLFPIDEVFTRGYSIPWGARDHALRAAMLAAAGGGASASGSASAAEPAIAVAAG